MKNILILFAFVLLTFSCEKEETEPIIKVQEDPTDKEPVAVAKKIKTSLRTNLVNNSDGSSSHTYDVRVYLPVAYEENNNLPIIYLMNDAFGINSTLFQTSEFIFDNAIYAMESLNLDAILVSADTDFRAGIDYAENREGEANFREFFQTEFIPFIEEKYPHDNSSRTLMGVGIGGRFVIGSMFLEDASKPVFENFIANDPGSLGLLNALTIEPNDFPQNKGDLKLFVSLSKDLLGSASLEGRIESVGKVFLPEYPWLTAWYEELFNYDHKTITKAGFTAGLEYIFGEE